ncbi:MAG: hypothetical protein IPK82_26030 [Polyangiaceae bacterium]|nr:hypothetical protein [Polyangiaceae bacterium]
MCTLEWGPHTCAVKKSGDLYCWGSNGFGQLGLGTTTTATSPQKVPGTLPYLVAAPGNEHTCAIQTSGKLYCWGASYSAQLGVGVPFLSAPTPILNPL